MAAANTDKFKKLARRWVGQIGSGGVADADVTTVPLASATNLPAGTAVIVVIDRVDANGTSTASLEESVIGVVSGTNLVTCTRGAEGTAQAHAAGAVVEVLVTAKGLNDLLDGILVQHDQLGLHTNITACKVTASDTVTGLNVTATQTVAASNVTASNVTASEAVFTDVVSEKSSGVGVAIDSFAVKDGLPKGNHSGWIDPGETLTYASATTFTVPGDQTGKYTIGCKLKLTNTTVKYFYVVGSNFDDPDTTITILGGTDYALANAAISANYYSYQNDPQGFPKWMAYTPTLSVQTGAITASTETGSFFMNGNAMFVTAQTVVATVGTAADQGFFTLPVNVSSAGVTNQGGGFYSNNDGAGCTYADAANNRLAIQWLTWGNNTYSASGWFKV